MKLRKLLWEKYGAIYIMSKELKVSQNTIYSFFKGEPSYKLLKIIRRELKLSAQEIIDFMEKEYDVSQLSSLNKRYLWELKNEGK